MVWQTVPDIDITTNKRVHATIYITMLLEWLKTVASGVRSLTVNDTEKSVTINTVHTATHAVSKQPTNAFLKLK